MNYNSFYCSRVIIRNISILLLISYLYIFFVRNLKEQEEEEEVLRKKVLNLSNFKSSISIFRIKDNTSPLYFCSFNILPISVLFYSNISFLLEHILLYSYYILLNLFLFLFYSILISSLEYNSSYFWFSLEHFHYILLNLFLFLSRYADWEWHWKLPGRTSGGGRQVEWVWGATAEARR